MFGTGARLERIRENSHGLLFSNSRLTSDIPTLIIFPFVFCVVFGQCMQRSVRGIECDVEVPRLARCASLFEELQGIIDIGDCRIKILFRN